LGKLEHSAVLRTLPLSGSLNICGLLTLTQTLTGFAYPPERCPKSRTLLQEVIEMDETIDKLVSILKKHGAKRIEIFGSYARGEAKSGSDLDVIVEFKKRKSLLELVGIEQELEDVLGMKVDLLTKASISPYLIERIEKESKVVFG